MLAKPLDGSFYEQARDTQPAAGILDHDVMNESGHVAQLLPRCWLNPRVDITDNRTCAFSDKDDSIPVH